MSFIVDQVGKQEMLRCKERIARPGLFGVCDQADLTVDGFTTLARGGTLLPPLATIIPSITTFRAWRSAVPLLCGRRIAPSPGRLFFWGGFLYPAACHAETDVIPAVVRVVRAAVVRGIAVGDAGMAVFPVVPVTTAQGTVGESVLHGCTG